MRRYLTDQEAGSLVRLANVANVLHLPYDAGELYIDHHPGNAWAFTILDAVAPRELCAFCLWDAVAELPDTEPWCADWRTVTAATLADPARVASFLPDRCDHDHDPASDVPAVPESSVMREWPAWQLGH